MTELIIIAVAIAAVVVYSIILWRRKPSELWSWISGLLATLISIVLGVVVALLLFGYTGDQMDAINKARFQNLLRAEMTDSFRVLANEEMLSISVGQTTHSVLVAYIQPIAIEEAAKSGLFEDATAENLLHLARKMRMYNLETQYLLAVVASGNSNTVGHACMSVEATRQAILADITFVMKTLHMELSPSIELERR